MTKEPMPHNKPSSDAGGPHLEIRTYKGTGVSPGIAIGRALIIEKDIGNVYLVPIKESEIDREIDRLHVAIDKTKAGLRELKAKVSRSIGDEYASIFEAHLMIVSDPSFGDQVMQHIVDESMNAEWALQLVKEELEARSASFDDESVSDRGEDIRDVAQNVLQNLLGFERHDLSEIDHDVIMLAEDLTPSDTIHFNRKPIVGFATAAGGRTSHTSIIAKSLFMPAVIGVDRLIEVIDNDEMVIIDGYEGTVVVNPNPALIAEYRGKVFRHAEYERKLLENRDLDAITKDNVSVRLVANIELIEEVDDALRFGARGVGLYRSEFLYISKSPELPTEEEHFEIYCKLAKAMDPHPVIIRTFDLGGKKLAREVIGTKEDNPVLGLRGLRLCMKHRKMFVTQLRGILRASAHGPIQIMFPLVSNVQEVRQVKSLLKELKRELASEGIAFNPDIEVGIMIEVPAAALMADVLAKEVDFFAIGTNDLIQYSLAIDRGNENVSYLYEPLHPALLRLLKFVIEAGKSEGIPVSVCGEMAGHSLFAIALVGLGLEVFSMNPSSIPVIKNVIRELRYKDCRKMIESALTKATAQEIEEYIIETVALKFPEGLVTRTV